MEESVASYAEEKEADVVRARTLKRDGVLEDSAVEDVEADTVEEKDNEADRFIGLGNTVDARESE